MTLTKKQKGVIAHASRSCGLAYRSPRLDAAKELVKMGLLYVHDRGEHKKTGRFVFKPTTKTEGGT